MKYELVLIINLGGTNNQMLARQVRDNHVYCEVAPYGITAEKLKEINPKGIIFSVGNIEESKKANKEMMSQIEALNIPTTFTEGVKTDQKNEALCSFLYDTCKCQKGWKMEDFANSSIEQLKEKLKGKKSSMCPIRGRRFFSSSSFNS